MDTSLFHICAEESYMLVAKNQIISLQGRGGMSSFYHGFYGKSFAMVCGKLKKHNSLGFSFFCHRKCCKLQTLTATFCTSASTHWKGTFRDAAATSCGQPILDFVTLFEANILLLSKAGWFPGESHQPRHWKGGRREEILGFPCFLFSSH